ncbi:hypothetical protein JT350_gp25 [Salmonella phage SAP012]|uniref:Uncharacterized protein n=1 Tax=Salmonella phage SAP012 TaxID=2742114 RepID=A0A6J4EFB5_9CAUD|nr:hypothetical protein JT350_gp25 [Salmonella phage SAP012]WHM53147.1 hypothetical protein XAP3_0050 [Xanthomonas phage XAP3]BCG45188.1 hypothetical protein [Salmonella phage SAP012]
MKKIAALSLFTLIVCLVLLILSRVGAAIGCEDVSSQTGLQTKYSTLSGCYVWKENRWVPIDWGFK